MGGVRVPNLELKQRKVDELADQLSQAGLAVLADYRGLTVVDMLRLRGRLRADRHRGQRRNGQHGGIR